MADKSAIEWTDATWTPIRARVWEIQNDGSGKERIGWHCEHASEGCRFCYAGGFNRRLGTGRNFKPGELYRQDKRGYKNGEVELFLDEEMLTAPLRWKRPRMVFVCSMTDLFADFVPDEWIDRIFAVMALAPQHTFQALTKRAKRMREYIARVSANPIPRLSDDIAAWMGDFAASMPMFAERSSGDIADELAKRLDPDNGGWPLRNVWLGVSAERQQEADERIPELLATPAALRFISAEPLLGPIDFHQHLLGFPAGYPAACACGHGHGFDRCPNYGKVATACHARGCDCRQFRKAAGSDGLHWIIVGGESGPDARPMHPAWPRAIRDQCAAAGVPFFFKQWGAWAPGENAVAAPTRTEQTATWFDDRWIFESVTPAVSVETHAEDAPDLYRLGKKRAGRLLDGVEHNAFPQMMRDI